DHDLNNLIAQYYQPRLIAQEGEAGMGKGMDGHAGKDLLVKVPCGTIVWRMAGKNEPEPLPQSEKTLVGLHASSAHRPLFRTTARGRAMEIDLSEESPKARASTNATADRELVADLV